MVTGSFYLHFPEERAARAAARDVRGAGFAVDVHESSHGQWVMGARRREPFPTDEQHRYVSKLQGLVNQHGGACDRFVPDS
jgi:hypothetical protein